MNKTINNIKKNLAEFYRELERAAKECGRDPESVEVLFATKYLNGEQLADFIEIYQGTRGGQALIGENRVQEAEEKFSFLEKVRLDLKGKYRKIMIGNLQKNKINKALKIFHELWGVDSPELARAINERIMPGKIPVFLEVNVSGEEAKHGISPDQLEEAIKSFRELKCLKLRGLMTMAPFSNDPEDARGYFKQLKQLADRFDLLTSMGMSNDWQAGVAEGADILRIGSGIFRRK